MTFVSTCEVRSAVAVLTVESSNGRMMTDTEIDSLLIGSTSFFPVVNL